MGQSINAANNCTHVQNESGKCALSGVDADPGSSDVVVEVKHGHMMHFEAIVVVGVLVCFCCRK